MLPVTVEARSDKPQEDTKAKALIHSSTTKVSFRRIIKFESVHNTDHDGVHSQNLT